MKPKSLSEVVDSLRSRNDQLQAYLDGDSTAITRVANSPDVDLEDATERARKYWDSLEQKRQSVPPKKS